jgi:putative YphP/YqiW family bacilliredoxin
MYDPEMVQPMRDEVTSLGVKELRTPDEVDAAVKQPGTTLLFVNSVCGCAAGGARPGLRMSLMNEKKPDQMVTVFAGMEREATAQAREHFKPYQPSSPQIALLKDGEVVKMFQRHDIEGKDPSALAHELTSAFDEHC